jgi:hypothetical protein
MLTQRFNEKIAAKIFFDFFKNDVAAELKTVYLQSAPSCMKKSITLHLSFF